MKKTYTKPEIFFESFTLSTNIAADCEEIFSLMAQDICGIPNENGIPNKDIFNLTVVGTQCDVHGYGNEQYNGLCYHVPTEAHNLFNS